MPLAHIPHALIITGPTGVGKTDLSLTVGQRFGGEIINADVGQFYKPLTIGTAKPNWQAQPIAHHLFDVLDQPIDFNSAAFRLLAKKNMQEIVQRNHLPVIVGGSCFYVQAVLQEPCVHTAVQKRFYDQATDVLWHELERIDPERAANIALTDRYRITRALDIWYGRGCMPSQCAPTFAPLALKTLLVVLTRPVDELYARINARVVAMVNAGWLDEICGLDEHWQAFLLRKKLIGYDDFIRYVRDGGCLSEVIACVQQKTRNYAKRQLTFLRRLRRICQPHVGRVAIVWHEIRDENADEPLPYIKEWYESR